MSSLEVESRILELTGLARRIAGRVTASFRADGYGVEFDDVMSGALYGAWKAAESYDPTRGTKLTTHAFDWIKRYAVLAARRDAGLPSRVDGATLHFEPIPEHGDEEGPEYPATALPDGEVLTVGVVVREAVAGLPELDRQVVYLTYWKDLGPTEVGRVLGFGKTRARAVLARAHGTMREYLQAA